MDLNFFIYCFITLFIIADPIGGLPVFISLLSNFDKKQRKWVIRFSVFISTIVLIVFTLVGGLLFSYLQVEMYSFKIAGGILLFIISIEMLFGMKSHTKSSAKEEEESMKKEDIAITPLAFPMLAGPGSITTVIVLSNTTSGSTEKLSLIFCVISVYLVSYLILSSSDRISKMLGRTGTMALVRIMGIVLSAISVQFVLTGLSEAIKYLL